MEQFLETCKNIGVVISCATGVIAFVGMIFKPVRKRFVDVVVKHSKADSTQAGIEQLSNQFDDFAKEVRVNFDKMHRQLIILTDGNQAGLAHQITNMYYENLDDKSLRVSDWDDLTKMYTAYKAEGGNSFIDGLYNKMKLWDIVE